jgi:hypothetical protein
MYEFSGTPVEGSATENKYEYDRISVRSYSSCGDIISNLEFRGHLAVDHGYSEYHVPTIPGITSGAGGPEGFGSGATAAGDVTGRLGRSRV